MFKFLRKYNKWILAVGGTILMIVFLVPQAFQGLSRAAAVSGAPRATIGPSKREVPVAELQQAQRELQLFDRNGQGLPFLGRISDPWHWYLLVQEAKEAGLVGGSSVDQFDPQQADLIRRQTGLSIRDLSDASARFNGVNILIRLYQTSGELSDRRLRAEADRLFEGVLAQPVVIAASADAIDEEPSEAEIRAQMEAHADVFPGEGEDSPFGYRLPNRVKLEWLTVPTESVRETIRKSDALSGTELRKHWKLNSGDPKLPPYPDQPPTTVPDAVREDLLQQLTDAKIEEIARHGTNQLRAKAHGMPRREGYLQLPEDWRETRLQFEDLAQDLASRFDLSLPEYRSSGETWLDPAALRALEGVGGAGTDKFPPGTRSLENLVSLSKELGGSPTVLIQQDVAGPPLRDSAGNLYFFRIIDTDPSRPPRETSEVRDAVVKDLKRIQHYESLVSSLDEIEAQAETEGLLAVALDHDTVVQRALPISRYDERTMQVQNMMRQPLTPTPTSLPIIGANEETVSALLDYAATLPKGTNYDQLTPEQRIKAMPVDDQLAVVVFRLLEPRPLTEDRYRSLIDQSQIQQILLTEELDAGQVILDAFSREALAKRHQFVELRSGEEEDETETAPTEPAQSG